jgi:putative transposase
LYLRGLTEEEAMARKRRLFSSTFKAKVALDAVRALKTVGELAKQHQVHPTQIALWKKQLLEGAEALFDQGQGKKSTDEGPPTAELYEQIGKLNMQLEWLKKKVSENGG